MSEDAVIEPKTIATRVADPHHFIADPGPYFHFYANPDQDP